nr:hypothetical protein [Tanacetum cinerariifolium]
MCCKGKVMPVDGEIYKLANQGSIVRRILEWFTFCVVVDVEDCVLGVVSNAESDVVEVWSMVKWCEMGRYAHENVNVFLQISSLFLGLVTDNLFGVVGSQDFLRGGGCEVGICEGFGSVGVDMGGFGVVGFVGVGEGESILAKIASPACDPLVLLICTDIAKITRKEPKTTQKRTRERNEYTRAGNYQGEGSGTPTESHHTPTSKASQSSQHQLPSPSLPPVITESLPTVIPSDNPLSGNTPGELGLLSPQIKVLEDKDRVAVEQSRDDAPIKGRSLDEGEEAAKRVSDDTEEMATVLTSMDAASILTSRGVQVVPTTIEVATATVSIPTGSGVVSTASPTIPTVALIFTTATKSTLYTRRKGKEIMVESDTPKKNKGRTANDHNSLDRSNETVLKYPQEYEQIPKDLSIGERIELISDLVKYQENYAQVLKYQTLQRKPRSKKQKKDYYMAGRIIGNKMHKAFPLPVIEFPLSEEVPTTSKESSHCQNKRDATVEKIALLLKPSSNCQSKSYDSYAKLVPHV